MPGLQRLYMTANSVTDLSDMAGIKSGALQGLEELSLDMNQISGAPLSPPPSLLLPTPSTPPGSSGRSHAAPA
jgi:hypothetical protein